MLTPNEARERILAQLCAIDAVERVPLADAAGRRLARPAISDVDLPPFEKSMMDGFALSSASFDGRNAPLELRCVGESRAGQPFEGEVPAGSCIEIYTGAELPPDCDAVEMVEYTQRAGDRVTFERPVRAEQNVSHRSEILAAGKAVFEPPRRLSAADLSVLASIGCEPVPVRPRLRVSVLTTGDELVRAHETPGAGQIREGNTLFLAAAVRGLGCEVLQAGIVADEAQELEAAFRAALDEGDALITTGGVSVGKYDLVGAAFERIGVEPVLHKVAIKPGKPIWFGMAGPKPVFGLPGNPVSSLLGFEVFVRPALACLAGGGPEEQAEDLRRGRWRGPAKRSAVRQFNLPARTRPGADCVVELEPVPFRGSADIVSAARANAFVVVPADGRIEPDELVEYRPIAAGGWV